MTTARNVIPEGPVQTSGMSLTATSTSKCNSVFSVTADARYDKPASKHTTSISVSTGTTASLQEKNLVHTSMFTSGKGKVFPVLN